MARTSFSRKTLPTAERPVCFDMRPGALSNSAGKVRRSTFRPSTKHFGTGVAVV